MCITLCKCMDKKINKGIALCGAETQNVSGVN